MESSLKDATVTVRIIRSFEHRNHRNLVLKHLDLPNMTINDLKHMIHDSLKTVSALKPIANHNYDTLKLYSQPHGAKCNNPIINVGGDDHLIMKSDDLRPLNELGIGHETEISYFNYDDYHRYQLNPTTIW